MVVHANKVSERLKVTLLKGVDDFSRVLLTAGVEWMCERMKWWFGTGAGYGWELVGVCWEGIRHRVKIHPCQVPHNPQGGTEGVGPTSPVISMVCLSNALTAWNRPKSTGDVLEMDYHCCSFVWFSHSTWCQIGRKSAEFWHSRRSKQLKWLVMILTLATFPRPSVFYMVLSSWRTVQIPMWPCLARGRVYTPQGSRLLARANGPDYLLTGPCDTLNVCLMP